MPTSAELIQADLDAGKIDEPTALLYRVYAMFGDPRLPTQYATETWSEDRAALAEADAQLGTLPADVAAAVRPFLVRPTDPLSVFNQAQTGAVSEQFSLAAVRSTETTPDEFGAYQIGNTFSAGDFQCTANGWGYIDSGSVAPGPGWKMWTVCGDQTALGQLVILANWMPRYYKDEIALMGPPIPDTLGGPAEAGDGPIDIYLTDQCVSTGGRCLGTAHDSASAFGFEKSAAPCQAVGAADKCSGFLVINRSKFSNLDTPGTLAHEFFHLLQDAHNAHGVLVSGTYNWFSEASAKWAQFRWHPASRPRRVYPYFDDFISTKLGLTTVDGNNEYVSFVWPLFMTESGPAGEDLIGQAWRAIEGQVGNKAVNTAISSAVPFDTKFREFAVTAWNDPLEPGPDPINPHFWDLDGALSHEMPQGPKFRQEDLQANDRGVPPLRISVDMPALSARYAELFPSEGVHQITVNFSNLAPAANFDVDALLNIKDKGWEQRKLDKGDTRFCRDDPADDVQELIIVLANHDIESNVSGDWTVESLKEPCAGYQVEIDWTDVYNNIADTIHFKGQIDTVDLTVPTDPHSLYMTGTGTASGARAGWKACNPGIADTPEGSGNAIFQAIITDDTITVNAFADIDTPLSGVTTDLFMAKLDEVDKEDGATVVIDPRQPFGDLCPHYSYGAATIKAYAKQAPTP